MGLKEVVEESARREREAISSRGVQMVATKDGEGVGSE